MSLFIPKTNTLLLAHIQMLQVGLSHFNGVEVVKYLISLFGNEHLLGARCTHWNRHLDLKERILEAL
jgi:uncharacterized membrane protein